jgi:RNA polymerase sigma-70 factor (ECF subfamily)
MTMSHIDTTRDLVHAARDGDEDAFCELVRRERSALLMTASAMLSDRHEAEDVAQEACIEAFRGISGLRDPDRFRPWIARILTRIAIRRRKSLRRRKPTGDLARLPERRAPDHDRLDALVLEVRRLPDKYRLPLSLHYLTGLSYREVAGVTGISVGRVKSRLHDARALLRRRLRHVED